LGIGAELKLSRKLALIASGFFILGLGSLIAVGQFVIGAVRFLIVEGQFDIERRRSGIRIGGELLIVVHKSFIGRGWNMLIGRRRRFVIFLRSDPISELVGDAAQEAKLGRPLVGLVRVFIDSNRSGKLVGRVAKLWRFI
jgi:hypothetical protein